MDQTDQTDYRRNWRAAAAAYFALQVRDHMARGGGIVVEDYDGFYEEAEFVGRQFATRAVKDVPTPGEMRKLAYILGDDNEGD